MEKKEKDKDDTGFFWRSAFERAFIESYSEWLEINEAKILGSFLYKCRSKLGLTQEEFSEEIQLSKNTYCGIEYNPDSKKPPYGHTISKFTKDKIMEYLKKNQKEDKESYLNIPLCEEKDDINGGMLGGVFSITPLELALNDLYDESDIANGLPETFYTVASVFNSVFSHNQLKRTQTNKIPWFVIEELVIGDYHLYRFYPSSCISFYGCKGKNMLDGIAGRVIPLHSNYNVETDSIVGIEPISNESVCRMLKFARISSITPEHKITFFECGDAFGVEKGQTIDFNVIVPVCEKYIEFYHAMSNYIIGKMEKPWFRKSDDS